MLTLRDVCNNNTLRSDLAKYFFCSCYDTCDIFNSIMFEASAIINLLSGANIYNFAEDRICNNVSFTENNIGILEAALKEDIKEAKRRFINKYSSDIERISNANIEGQEKIKTELDRAADVIIDYINKSSDSLMLEKATGIDFNSAIKVGMDSVEMKKIIVKYVIELKEFFIGMFGNSFQMPQELIQQPHPSAEVQVIPNVVPTPQQPITAPVAEPAMAFTPQPIPMPMGATSVGAMPFVMYNSVIPQYPDPEINKHFVYNNVVNIPNPEDQERFRNSLLAIAKDLDNNGLMNSVFAITEFRGIYDWIAERFDPATSTIVGRDSENYQNIISESGKQPQLFIKNAA